MAFEPRLDGLYAILEGIPGQCGLFRVEIDGLGAADRAHMR